MDESHSPSTYSVEDSHSHSAEDSKNKSSDAEETQSEMGGYDMRVEDSSYGTFRPGQVKEE